MTAIAIGPTTIVTATVMATGIGTTSIAERMTVTAISSGVGIGTVAETVIESRY